MEFYKDAAGNVGVLISPGYGAGWSTWNVKEFAFDKRIIEAVLEFGAIESISESCITGTFDKEGMSKFEGWLSLVPDYKHVKIYYNGLYDYWQIGFYPPSTRVRIAEYDGSESVVISREDEYTQLF